jgi:hypothetical protein
MGKNIKNSVNRAFEDDTTGLSVDDIFKKRDNLLKNKKVFSNAEDIDINNMRSQIVDAFLDAHEFKCAELATSAVFTTKNGCKTMQVGRNAIVQINPAFAKSIGVKI